MRRRCLADDASLTLERVLTSSSAGIIALRSLIAIVDFLYRKEHCMLKHNTYFEGRVQSLGFERNGLKASVGVIAPGEYHFGTGAAERMTVISGLLAVKLDGASEWHRYAMGTSFEVPANSGFDVQAIGGPAAYLCEFLAVG